MANTIITADLDAVISEIEIAAPPERVFEALTDPSQLQRWFGGDANCPVKFWKMDARLGGHYSYATEISKINVNGVKQFQCQGEILEYDPPRLLAYTWIGNWHLDPKRRTVVRWELLPISFGTHVTVKHSGLAQEPEARKDYSGGWVGVMEQLKQFSEKESSR